MANSSAQSQASSGVDMGSDVYNYNSTPDPGFNMSGNSVPAWAWIGGGALILIALVFVFLKRK